jgi:Zn-dependent protease/predicted transcriptional regulator
MLENAFRLGSVAGIRIGVHYTWFFIFFLLASALYQSFSIEHSDWSQSTALLTAILTTLLFFISIILHELGHSIVAMRHGIQVRSITLFIFGGVAQTEKEAESAGTEFRVAIAGPIVSLVLSGLFYSLAGLLSSLSEVMTVALTWLGRINLIVAIFNMIPGFPLDGGRVFRALVWAVSGNASTGMKWAVASGKLLAYLLMVFGLFLVIQPGLLFNGLWMLAIGWFLFFSAQASGQTFIVNRIFRAHQAREYMDTEFHSVSGRMSIHEWLENHVFTEGRRAYVVTSDGQATGLVTLSDCNKVARTLWDSTALYEIMTPLGKLHAVSPTTSISDVLQLMVSHSLNQVPVVQYDRIIGWIDRERLIRIIQLHNETGA